MGQRNALSELLFTKPQQPAPNSLAALVGDAAANVRAGAVGTVQAREPSWRERTGNLLQDALEKLDVDRYRARRIAQTIVGGESSNLPLRMGLLDPTAVGALFARQESPNMGPGAPSGMLGATGPAIVQAMRKKRTPLDEMRDAVAQISDLADQHGTVYVRWSPSSSRDMRPGAVSRDFLSGGNHAGLSAVPIDSGTHPVDIAKSLAEYNFLRMQDRRSVPHIYSANRVGTDSDGYASIADLKLLTSPKIVPAIDKRAHEAMELIDDIQRMEARVAKGSSQWLPDIEKKKERLKKIGFEYEPPQEP